MITLTNIQARQMLLLKHGLIGEYKFIGKKGALEFVRQAGCIQFDPVDVCGKNAELTLQSRVQGFTKRTLYGLLYGDRSLVDYPDKNLSIFPVEDWPYFTRYRKAAMQNGLQFDGLAELEKEAKAYIGAHGPVSAKELPLTGKVHWHSAIHWSGNWSGESQAARSVLEQLYSTGELVIHHKEGARKFYDLAERHIAERLLAAPDPLPDEDAHLKWRVLRRIGGVGLLWDRPSDAWLNIWGLDTGARGRAFQELLSEGKIVEARVEGINAPLYFRAEDLPLAEEVKLGGKFTPRCELIAPLDCLLWDRKLIRALFGFEYTWEIYTPAVKRKYGYYVLPMLYGDQLIGRAEAVPNAAEGVLTVKNLWFEDGVKLTDGLHREVRDCFERFARFNGCERAAFAQS